ncbi:MAG: Wzy polymerase domain-containing protein, partial [Burkholderiaceae bacterium]
AAVCGTGEKRGDRCRDIACMAAAAGLLSIANAASLSRTGVLQLVAILVLAFVWHWWRIATVRRLLLLAVLAYVLASLLLPWLAGRDPFVAGIVDRFGSDAHSCQSRLVLWSNVLHLISLRPWSGWGWGELDFAHFMTLYPGTRFCDILDNAHNLPLHLAVELGIPVAVALCSAVAWLVWRAKPHRETVIERQLAWAVLALIALHSMVEYPLWYGPFQMATVLCIWILVCVPAGAKAEGIVPLDTRLQESMQPVWSRRARVWLIGISLVTLSAVAYAMWDYHRVSQIYKQPEQRSPAYRDHTLAKLQGSWLFRRQVQFAELTLTRVDAANAVEVHALAARMLHFSPEPRVIERLIDSARLLGRGDEAEALARRFQAAFPREHALWAQRQRLGSATQRPARP